MFIIFQKSLLKKQKENLLKQQISKMKYKTWAFFVNRWQHISKQLF